jgi:hypothetical protein
MSAYALPTGRIFGEILTKPTKNGGQVTFFKMKVTNGNATEFWSISTFSDTVREELSGLSDGDAISVVGALTYRALRLARREARQSQAHGRSRVGVEAEAREAKSHTSAAG